MNITTLFKPAGWKADGKTAVGFLCHERLRLKGSSTKCDTEISRNGKETIRPEISQSAKMPG